MYRLPKLLSGADLVLVLGLAVATVPVVLLTPIRGVWSRPEPPAPHPQTEPPAPHPQTEPPAPHPQTEPPAAHPQTEPPAPHPQTEPPAPHPQTEPPAPHPQTSSATFIPSISFPYKQSRPYLCPEHGVLDVHAIADLDNHEGGQSHIFYWRLKVGRSVDETGKQETVWEKRYDEKWFECRPGTHTRPEFIQKLMMPKGVYRVQVMLVECGWELSSTGRHLAEKSSDLSRRFWAMVR